MYELILNNLYEGKKISYQDSYKLFSCVINEQLSTTQIAAMLISMKMKGEYYEEIAGAVDAMLKNIKYFPSPNYLFADVVGTGGDYKNSINISTISAIVAAGCGVKIAKHNNKSISSISGSSDLLKLFGLNLYMSPRKSRQLLDKLGICFLFSPAYNDIFDKRITEVRLALKTRTIFNIIGPLLNPAKPKLLLIGAYSDKLLLPIIQTVKFLKYKRVLAIHSGGMDEVTLYKKTHVIELKNNKIKRYSLYPEDFGLKYQSANLLTINSIKENYEITSNLLQGKGIFAHESVIAANVSLLLKLFGNEDLRKNTCLALDEIRSGNSYKRMISLVNKDKS